MPDGISFSVIGAAHGGDITAETEGVGLVSPSPQSPGERQRLSGVVGRLIDPPD